MNVTPTNDTEKEAAVSTSEEGITVSRSDGLPKFLRSNRISFAMSVYHGNSIFFIGTTKNSTITLIDTNNGKTLGMTMTPDGEIYTSNSNHILRFVNIQGVPEQHEEDYHDKIFAMRTAHVTGLLDAHDIRHTNEHGIVFVATQYNCIAKLDPLLSFKVVWMPEFITDLVREDRCHLNGIATKDGVLKYATAHSASNTIDGWRDRRKNGGVIIDIETNKIICRGLSMPHSPRVHNGQLWVCNSGTGHLGTIDFTEKDLKKRFKPHCFCPGFIRGLDFIGQDYAVVGLSSPRYERFTGLELDEALERADSEPWTGFQIISLKTGEVVHWLRVDGPIKEIYDIIVLKDTLMPIGMGFFDERTIKVVRVP